MMIELTDLITEQTATVPAQEVAAKLQKWSPGSWEADAIGEFQAAVLAEDFEAMAELAAELGIGYDFPR